MRCNDDEPLSTGIQEQLRNLMRRRPHPRSWLAAMIPRIISRRFEQPVLKGQFLNAFFKDTRPTAQILHGPAGRSMCIVTGKPLLTSLHELVRPCVKEAPRYALLAAELGYTAFPAPPITILILSSTEKCRRVVRRISLTTRLAEAFGWPKCSVSSSYLRYYNETKTHLKSQHLICAIGADGEHFSPPYSFLHPLKSTRVHRVSLYADAGQWALDQ